MVWELETIPKEEGEKAVVAGGKLKRGFFIRPEKEKQAEKEPQIGSRGIHMR